MKNVEKVFECLLPDSNEIYTDGKCKAMESAL